jgi:hypothetical protein
MRPAHQVCRANLVHKAAVLLKAKRTRRRDDGYQLIADVVRSELIHRTGGEPTGSGQNREIHQFLETKRIEMIACDRALVLAPSPRMNQ